MKNKFIKNLVILLIVPLIVVIRFFYPWMVAIGLEPSFKNFDKSMQKYNAELTEICEYLSSQNTEYIRIDMDKGEKYSVKDGDKSFEIIDEKIIYDINTLKVAKYKHIIKESNYIIFVRFETFDSSCSLLYCKTYPQIFQGIYDIKNEIRNLSKENWFYYKNVTN